MKNIITTLTGLALLLTLSSTSYAALKRELPPNVEPAYDGMIVHFD